MTVEETRCSQQKLRAPPAPARSVLVDAARCAARAARAVLFARLHAAGQPDGADRHGAAPAAGVSGRAAALPECELVQLGLVVDPAILFPPEYPYTSGTTKFLRDNFAELYSARSPAMLGLARTIWWSTSARTTARCSRTSRRAATAFSASSRPMSANIANQRGIPTIKRYFGPDDGARGRARARPASVVTAANCFAHIEDVHEIVDGIVEMLAPDGVFISESHYLIGLLETLQYDTIYHEHLRYYSVASLKYLLEMHGLEVFHARRIPTPWRIDPRLCRRARARIRCKPSVAANARRRTARATPWRSVSPSSSDDVHAVEAAAASHAARPEGQARASSASARRRAPARWSTTSGSTMASSTTSAKSRARSRSASTCPAR